MATIKEMFEGNTAGVNTATELLKVLGDREGQYVWKQLTAEGGDFVAFVTADDEGSYPDGAMLDGYWYELVEEGSSFATNVWSRDILVQPEISLTNPTIIVNTYGRTSPFSHQIYCDAVDFTTMTDSQILSFIKDFKNNSYSITVSGSSVVYKSSMQSSSLTNLRRDGAHYVSFSGTNQISEYGQTLTYSGTKIIQNLVTEPIGFIVDNDSTAYPNNATHTDGFYYKLLAHVDSANVMRLSNDAYGVVETEVVNGIANEVGGVDY